jgi:PTS system glucose-specific IIC component
MSFSQSAFSLMQKIGKSMMLPVSVLPVAGILLGVGSANFSWLPSIVSLTMAQAGGAIFGFLPLLFAIAVAVGLTDNDGVAALASAVGYLVLLATMGVVTAFLALRHGVPANIAGAPAAHDLIGQIRQVLAAAVAQGKITIGTTEITSIMGMGSIETGVFGGIVIGLVAGWAFNRFYRVQLPSYLGFFAGKRSVPIITAFAAIAVGALLSVCWPPVGGVIQHFSNWASTGQPIVAFTIYGFVERLLIPLGLHHVWNVPFFFEVGHYVDPATGQTIRGEVNRYIAGDPSAGNMAGGYLFKMWGLPAAAMAMWRSAKPENRSRIGGIMISAALTAFLTGITEPIEFAFLFLAPALYVVHAVLAGLAYGLCILLGVKHGMTFSHGLIDFVVLYPKSHRAAWFFWLGPAYAAFYYGVFRYAIVKFDLKTPGREDEQATTAEAKNAVAENFALQIVRGLGGRSNIVSLDACITRLRVKLHDVSKVNAPKLKALGAAGVLVVGDSVQAIFGTRAENYKTDVLEYLKVAGPEADELDDPSPIQAQQPPSQAPPSQLPRAPEAYAAWKSYAVIAAMGGRENIDLVQACAGTRLRVLVKDSTLLDEGAIRAAGITGIARLSSNVLHLLAGLNTDRYAIEMREHLAAPPV